VYAANCHLNHKMAILNHIMWPVILTSTAKGKHPELDSVNDTRLLVGDGLRRFPNFRLADNTHSGRRHIMETPDLPSMSYVVSRATT